VSFQDIAQRRGLHTARLDELTWDVEPCPYQHLKVPAAPPFDLLLKVMRRRALEPALVTTLFDVFPNSPARRIERALLAYDVANAALLGQEDEALLARVMEELAPIKRFAQTTAAVTRDHVHHLIDAARPARDAPTALLDDLTTSTPSLGALLMLSEVRKSFDDAPELLRAILAHVKQLELAHLPTLAIAFLQILWDRFGNAEALDLLIELAIDHDMMDAIPLLTGTDDRALLQQTYLLVRASCARFDVVTAQRVLDAAPAAVQQAPYAPLILARAHLVLLQGQRFDRDALAVVEKIVPPGLSWRYANFVQDAGRLHVAPQDTALYVDSYTTSFGNNAYLWAQAADHDAARPQLLTLLSREIRYGAHEPHAWRAAAILLGNDEDDGSALNDELDRRMEMQMLTALRGPHGPPN
jgi:hypothetical protein